MRENLRKKAILLSKYIKGTKIADFGSEDGTGENVLHRYLETYSKKEILSVDFLGNPDIKVNFNKKFPFKKNTFDCIIASEIIEHLDNPLDFLKNCNNALKPGGMLLLTTPNAISIAEMQTLYKKGAKIAYTEHIYNWNKKNMYYLLKRGDFKVSHFEYISYHWRRNILLRSIVYLIPFLRANLFFVAKKKEKK